MKTVQAYLNEQINYGGEVRTRGSIIIDLQKADIPQKYIDAYMMGAKSIPEDRPHFVAGEKEHGNGIRIC